MRREPAGRGIWGVPRPHGRDLTGPELERFADEADIHRVRHAGSDPAVTLHVYSPPLLRMGAYVVGEDGVLARHSVAHTEELRQLADAAAVASAE